MAERVAILSAKVERLAAILADANSMKPRPPGKTTADDVRVAQAEAAQEVLGPKGSVAEVKAVKLPTERL